MNDRSWIETQPAVLPQRGIGNAFAVLAALTIAGCEAPGTHSVVPMPSQISLSGGAFTLDGATAIALGEPNDDELQRLVSTWAEPFRSAGSLSLPVAPAGSIRISLDGEGAAESYRLDVTPDAINLTGADHAGVFYGLQTLSQLLPDDAEAGGTTVGAEVPALSVQDAPRFEYRGMHLDVARHFFGPEEVKAYIDLLARYKMNRFHWHRTEDQVWRIQIDAYPELTEISAFREQTQIGHGADDFNGDGQRYGGFYTKDEIREIVAYAADRYITIIPEIEMPGHAQAALAAYPELACTEGPFEVAQTWGVFEDIFCPYDETFVFLETVLAEVIELFPGEYIHVGGDEAPTTRWEESEYVQELIVREGLRDITQVQPWFMRRIERFLTANGKKMIGWEEILGEDFGPGVSTDAVVMSWLGVAGAIKGTRKGHDVVMTPYSHVYFDYYQSQDTASEPFAIGGFLPLDTVYAYDPVPRQLRDRDGARIIGAQGNVWTEYMKTWDHVEYMLLPRMLALSEVVWSPPDSKDYEGFLDRLDWHFERFDALGVKYRPIDTR
jgi:hexosaminidase